MKSKGIESDALDAQLLIADGIGTDRMGVFLNYDKPLSDVELSIIREHTRKRLKGEPVAYILGKKEFFSLEFEIVPGVLIPRPETEYLVELALMRLKAESLKILEIGTGSGCISVSLASKLSKAKIIATDISDMALGLAKKNAFKHSVGERIEFVKSDLFENINGKFDLIISNPPYVSEKDREDISKEILNFEPHEALFADEDGFSVVRELIKEAPEYLNKDGLLMIEMGYNHWDMAMKAAEEAGRYDTYIVKPDLNDIDRYFIGKI